MLVGLDMVELFKQQSTGVMREETVEVLYGAFSCELGANRLRIHAGRNSMVIVESSGIHNNATLNRRRLPCQTYWHHYLEP